MRVAAPTGLGTYTEKPVAKVLDADIYVSTAGDDSNSGDISHPLRTIEKARSAVRKMDMTKAMLAARRNKVWMEAFPQMKRIVEDFDATKDPGYVTNPACSKVTGNLIINRDGNIGSIDERVYRFSDVSGNAMYRMDMMKKVFVDPDNGNYSLIEDSTLFEDCPGFEPIPLGKIGRY